MRTIIEMLCRHVACHGTPQQCDWDEALRAADASIEMEERFNDLGAGEPDRRPTAELRTSPVAGDPVIAGLLDKLDEHLRTIPEVRPGGHYIPGQPLIDRATALRVLER